MPSTPTIEPGIPDERGRPGMLVRFPYSEGAKEDLKEDVASWARKWSPDAGAWWVAHEYRDTAIETMLRYFPSVLLLGAGGEDDELLSRDGTIVAQTRLL